METLGNKLNSIRENAYNLIKDFFKENNLTYINLTDIDCNPPMATPTQSLDTIGFDNNGKMYFDCSGEYDNDRYSLCSVSTDLLVDVVEWIEYYKEDIIEGEI